MSADPAPISADGLVLGVLAPGMQRLRSLLDPSLHLAVVDAVSAQTGPIWDRALAGHRPDVITGRRVTALDAATAAMARSGILMWAGDGWHVSPRACLVYLNQQAMHLSPDQSRAVDALRQDWLRRSAAR